MCTVLFDLIAWMLQLLDEILSGLKAFFQPLQFLHHKNIELLYYYYQ